MSTISLYTQDHIITGHLYVHQLPFFLTFICVSALGRQASRITMIGGQLMT